MGVLCMNRMIVLCNGRAVNLSENSIQMNIPLVAKEQQIFGSEPRLNC